MNRHFLKLFLLVAATTLVAGCAKDEDPQTMKRERDRLSYQVTDLQNQLDKANAEIARLKAEK